MPAGSFNRLAFTHCHLSPIDGCLPAEINMVKAKFASVHTLYCCLARVVVVCCRFYQFQLTFCCLAFLFSPLSADFRARLLHLFIQLPSSPKTGILMDCNIFLTVLLLFALLLQHSYWICFVTFKLKFILFCFSHF